MAQKQMIALFSQAAPMTIKTSYNVGKLVGLSFCPSVNLLVHPSVSWLIGLDIQYVYLQMP